MYDLTVIDQFMETVIDQGQIYIGTFDHSVCHGICGKLYTICFKSFRLSFQRQCICILAIDDVSDQCRGSNAVTEKILWSWGFQDSPVIVFGSIDMDMMFIHDKCFRNDVQAFINFRREFFVTVRKFYCQFPVRKSVLDDTCRKLNNPG
jgi:hypothetical protein